MELIQLRTTCCVEFCISRRGQFLDIPYRRQRVDHPQHIVVDRPEARGNTVLHDTLNTAWVDAIGVEETHIVL
jgi:hypothetical protein